MNFFEPAIFGRRFDWGDILVLLGSSFINREGENQGCLQNLLHVPCAVTFQAEEITLTVGQAFDLAYRRFLESSGKDIDQKKQHLLLQKKVGNTDCDTKAKPVLSVLDILCERKQLLPNQIYQNIFLWRNICFHLVC